MNRVTLGHTEDIITMAPLDAAQEKGEGERRKTKKGIHK